MKNEIWKPVVGYEGLYEVSNLGRVRGINRISHIALHRLKERLLVPERLKRGYLRVSLAKDGNNTKHLLHRLVAQAFIPNPDNLPQINHKNEVKDDNCVENLEWCDNLYNSRYGTKNKRIGEYFKKPVFQMDLKGNIIARFDSVIDVERKIGINYRLVSECCNGHREKTKGYKWKFAEK